ncbi:sigma-70 family RNA polymerase sigma factor [bacterium]|nr:sigma-70 family RNA polymerase sigma factor [bacterium]
MPYHAYDLATKNLSFSINDLARVNELYHQWRQENSSNTIRELEIWAYCWIRRYFIRKFVKGKIQDISDTEQLIEDVFIAFFKKHHTLKNTRVLTHWISVICKYRYLNYVRAWYPVSEKLLEEAEEETEVDFENDILTVIDSKNLYQEVVSKEMNHLPEYIQAIVRKKIWEGKSYDEIATETGYSVETVRAYYSRALKELRHSESLTNLVKDW